MSFLKNMIKDKIREGVGGAISSAVQKAVEPRVSAYADKVARQYDMATEEISQQTARSTRTAASGMEGAFANLQRSMETYATEMSRNVKVCPVCDTPTTSDKKFCPNCGAKLPEQTLADSAVCPACGKQNAVGTLYCSDCGAKLPTQEAQREAGGSGDVFAQWQQLLPNFPMWNCGGSDYQIEEFDGCYYFTSVFDNSYAAQEAVRKYRELLLRSGFVRPQDYSGDDHLYKQVGGKWYHADTEHCFDSDDCCPTVGFAVE